jgi:hypothetical protein
MQSLSRAHRQSIAACKRGYLNHACMIEDHRVTGPANRRHDPHAMKACANKRMLRTLVFLKHDCEGGRKWRDGAGAEGFHILTDDCERASA